MSDTDKKDNENIGSFYMGRTRTPAEPKRQLPPGLLTTVALFALAGIIWYAYPRGAEKYTDIDVPVVKAETAPIKMEPVDPGGMEVPHQDSTVFEPLEKKPAAEVEKLQPTPEEPLDKDQALGAAEEEKPAVPAKLAPELSLDLQMKDPKSGTEKVVTKPAEEVTPAKKEESRTAPVITSGKSYIQLGSYRSTAGAKKDWEKLKKKYPDLLGKLAMKTEKTDIAGKGTFYRLQAGKVTEARAREICAVLKTANSGGCFLVRQ